MKRSFIFFLAAAAGFVVASLVVWLVLGADLDLKKADTTHAANPTTRRILALDQASHLAFWTFVLKNKKQACDVVVRTMYQGGAEAGVDSWSIGCQDGNEYSIGIDQDAQGSVCDRNAFAQSAE
jgi:hypothetical protein